MGDYVLSRNSVLRDNHDTAASFPSSSHEGKSGSVVWLDSQPAMSEASWQEHELARASEATASWAHRATANQEASRARSLSSNRDDGTERRRVAPIGSRPNVLEDGSKLNPVNENF